MHNIQGLITLDTFLPRQHTIIKWVKPKDIPYKDILGMREKDDPQGYLAYNKEVLELHKSELVDFLKTNPHSALVMNYYFGILPETRAFIQEQQSNIAKVLVVTCQDDFYEKYVQVHNYPINKKHIIAYSDDYNRRQDDIAAVLKR